jgi:2-dehydro-3-deoxygluconokinase
MFGPGGLDPADLSDCGLLYLSGITLAILSDADRARLVNADGAHKAAGRSVAFDGNYRPRLWSDPEEARHWIGRGACGRVDHRAPLARRRNGAVR